MALAPDRYHVESEIGYFCNDVTNRGVILCFGSSGSGAALDDTSAIAALPGASVAGLIPLGMLMNDMVNIDLSHFHLNFYKDQMPVGGKCTLWKKGWVCTDQVASGAVPVAGDPAYLAPYGQLTTTTGTPQIGRFLSAVDQNGFVKVELQLP